MSTSEGWNIDPSQQQEMDLVKRIYELVITDPQIDFFAPP